VITSCTNTIALIDCELRVIYFRKMDRGACTAALELNENLDTHRDRIGRQRIRQFAGMAWFASGLQIRQCEITLKDGPIDFDPYPKREIPDVLREGQVKYAANEISAVVSADI
jgi:hypothetical protein